MKQVECVNCGDTVVIPNRGEPVISGETPLGHIQRTGHPHKREPRPYACDDCEYVWMYSGDYDNPTCPNCRGKRTEPV